MGILASIEFNRSVLAINEKLNVFSSMCGIYDYLETSLISLITKTEQ